LEKDLRFGFGKNWLNYVKNAFNDESLQMAVTGLERLLQTGDLKSKTFLDIGCGSGLSSLAALKMGAKKAVSFDYDREAVEASLLLRGKSGIPEDRWPITQGSVMDEEFMKGLGKFDVVYSWGVLQHTNAMWDAIRRAGESVNPGGLYSIAIYNKVEGPRGSEFWWHVKKKYNLAGPAKKKFMEYAYIARTLGGLAKRGTNPVKYVREYKTRGMNFWIDVKDWLGGFPFEYASPEEITGFVQKELPMKLVYSQTYEGHACNEYTFRSNG